uniref:Mitochondrial import receptor subunit TOM70-like n=1 Tax=Dermatophagoides pteronyssinus TaxID=6956 RepID=A0A6P6XUX6_DERPT|nr:mitochondrial import receptor subunit TOM70-like [Dermatophagoides pteronyssinus]
MIISGLQSQLLSSNRLKLMLLATPVLIGSGLCLYYYYFYNKFDDEKSKQKKNNKTKDVPEDPIKAKLNEAIKLKNKGNELFRKKNYEEALKLYTQAIQLCPPDKRKEMSTFYQNRAACYEHMKQFEQVIHDSTKAIENDKRYVKAYLRRGKAYEIIANYEDACCDYYVASNLSQFQNSDYMNLLSECLEKYAYKRAEQVMSKRSVYTFQKYLFKHLLNKYSRDPLKLREKEIMSDNYDSIINDLLARNDDLNQDDLLLKGSIELYIGKHDDGQKRLMKLFETCDHVDYKVNALLKLAEHSLQNNKLEKTDQYLTDALALDDDNPDIYYIRSQMYIVQRKYEESIQDLKRSIELDPSFVGAIGQRLFIKYQQSIMTNNFIGKEQILQEFKSQIERFSTSNELSLLYFQILLSENKTSDAATVIQKALDREPDDPTLYVYRSLIFIEESSFDKAKEYLDKALELDSRCSFAYEMLSDLCSKLENFSQSIDYLERAINSSTTFEDVKNLVIKQKALTMQLQFQSL